MMRRVMTVAVFTMSVVSMAGCSDDILKKTEDDCPSGLTKVRYETGATYAAS
jgi:hypothetical protein